MNKETDDADFRHLSSDIELPEYNEEDDEDIEDDGNADEKDADYEDDVVTEGEKNRKKNKKTNKNRYSKKKDRNK